MGIQLSEINDPRLRAEIERQLGGQSTPATRLPVRTTAGESAEKESALHDKIIDYCRARGWFYVHSRLDRRSTIAVGSPDFCVALPSGKTVWLECKRPGGKPTLAQNAAIAQLRKLGHIAEVVEYFDDVRNLLENRNEIAEPPCRTCNGTGEVRHPRYGLPSCPCDVIPCPDCR